MTLRISTVADSISKLDVTDLVICDIDQIKVNADKRISSLVANDEYITDVLQEVNSTGGSTALMTLSYTLNYRLFYKPLGTGRTMTLEQVTGLVEMIGLIWDAIMDINTIDGCEGIEIANISAFGVVLDPADNPWWGCILGFRVKEFVR